MPSRDIPAGLGKALWAHQLRALRFALKRLRSGGTSTPTLIRMPTGTGKTGIIATLAIAMPPPGWTLILTPWSHLCTQMVDDLQRHFWSRVKWLPPVALDIERLYPRNIGTLLSRSEPQLVVVATFATLVSVFKGARGQHEELARRLGEVVVDEGHYEPAVEWGRAVKSLRRPTLLLTATPYRNDLKLFRVSKDDTFHYSHEEAEADGIVRRVDFRSLGVAEPADDKLEGWCDAFARFWRNRRRNSLPEWARAIIYCARMPVVQRVTRLLRARGIRAVGIHDRFGGQPEGWLLKDTPDPKKTAFDVWVHQNKLTEGLDDYRFCLVALLNGIRNDRKLIQQIGRVLRPQPGRAGDSRTAGAAVVLFSDDVPCERSWKNYRAFEREFDIAQSERYRLLLNTLLQNQPTVEYFGGRFRRRLDPAHGDLSAQVRLPPSSVVRRVRPSFDLDEFTDVTSDFLLLEDRMLLGPAEGALRAVASPSARLWVYALIGNSRLLVEHSLYELRLGALAAVRHGDLLFLSDTEGTYPTDYLDEHTSRVRHSELARVFDASMIATQAALSRPWPTAGMVKRSSISGDNLGDTPALLTDAVFVCESVRATTTPKRRGSARRRHYVGFPRGRIAEDLRSVDREAFNLSEFVAWTDELKDRITSARAAPEFFRRYMLPTATPLAVTPQYLILNLFDGEIHVEDAGGRVVELVESIVRVYRSRKDDADAYEFELRYRSSGGSKAHIVQGSLVYDREDERFRIQGEELNAALVVSLGAGEVDTLVGHLNGHDENFAVALDTPDVFYSGGSFFKIDYSYAAERLTALLTSWPPLATCTSEKGPKRTRTRMQTKWPETSVFGVIDHEGPGGLLQAQFGRAEWLLCDDLGTEVADFLCATFRERRIAFIHAKHGADRIVSASALHDVVAQALKNLSVLPRRGAQPAHVMRWDRESVWDKTRIRRWRRPNHTLPTRRDLWRKVREEILDHPEGTAEVWLVVGGTLSAGAFAAQLSGEAVPDSVTGQVVHLLSGLHAECTQRAATLRVFCD